MTKPTAHGFTGAAHDGRESRDVSEDADRTSAAAVRPRAMVTLPCACGGAIRGDRFCPMPYVAAHNRSWRHRDWRAAREYGDYLVEIQLEKVPV